MSERKSGHVCAVKKCHNKRYNCNKKFFSFPRQPDRARVWAITANREDLLEKLDKLHKSHRLCADHFEQKMYTNHLCERLSAKAFPTLFLSLEGNSSDIADDQHKVTDPVHDVINDTSTTPAMFQISTQTTTSLRFKTPRKTKYTQDITLIAENTLLCERVSNNARTEKTEGSKLQERFKK